MSATTQKIRKSRGPQERFYIDPRSDEMTCRYKGVTQICDVTDIPSAVWHRLAQEGYVRLSQLGKTHAEIAAGQAFPDRTPPGATPAVHKKAAALTEEVKAARKAALNAARRQATAEKKALIARLLAEHKAKTDPTWAESVRSRSQAAD